MKTLSEFQASVEDHIGDLNTLLKAGQVERWCNDGQARLGLDRRLSVALSLASGSTTVNLPADFKSVEGLLPSTDTTLDRVPQLRIWGTAAYFEKTDSPTGAVLLYRASYPKITEAQASLLPALADEALVSFCLYRFFIRLAANRADFRRYSVLTGATGVGVDELREIADGHLADFEAVREQLVEDFEAASFYED